MPIRRTIYQILREVCQLIDMRVLFWTFASLNCECIRMKRTSFLWFSVEFFNVQTQFDVLKGESHREKEKKTSFGTRHLQYFILYDTVPTANDQFQTPNTYSIRSIHTITWNRFVYRLTKTMTLNFMFIITCVDVSFWAICHLWNGIIHVFTVIYIETHIFIVRQQFYRELPSKRWSSVHCTCTDTLFSYLQV